MKFFTRIIATGLCGLIGTGAVGSGGAHAQLGQAQPVPGNAAGAAAGVQAGNGQVGANVQVGNAGVGVQAGAFNGYGQVPWYNNPGVRQQLQWNDTQYNQMNRHYAEAWNRYNDGVSQLDNKLTPEQLQQREAELQSGFHQDFSKGMTSTLSNPAAQQQYNQLFLQYRGYGAFNDPTVQQNLNLTPEQRQKFSQYDHQWNTQLNTWRGEYPTNREAIVNQFNESRQQAQTRINSTLTPEQRATWSEMTGKPYNFQPDVYFPNKPSTTTTLKPVVK